MFVDSRTLPNNEQVNADICIIGAGAAGITLALELAGTGRRVVLIESGGFEADPRTEALSQGESIGLEYRVDDTRSRYFGGTTNIWGGACRPLDELDFVARDWMAHSGWPFLRAELLPYYKRARPYLQLPEEEDRLLSFPWHHPWEGALWEGSPPTRFGERYRIALAQSSDVRVFLNANLLELKMSPRDAVENALFGVFGGKQFSVAAGRYVLACGGLENARLLLIASRTGPGLNAHDLVGRFFMEHASLQIGFLVHRHLGTPDEVYFDRGGHSFRLADDTQRLEGVGAAGCYPTFRPKLADVPGLEKLFDPHVRGPLTLLMLVFEQSPAPDSRVTLSDGLDEFGLPRLRLDWRLNALDRRTYSTAMRFLFQQTEKSCDSLFWIRPQLRGVDFSRPETIPLEAHFGRDFKAMPFGAFSEQIAYDHGIDTTKLHCQPSHHMGTTRMHMDPRRGAVDANCLLHGSRNLYVTGSSCFPTGGISNPTLTIVAMALRLADHLKQTL
jgi:hypothetical protein